MSPQINWSDILLRLVLTLVAGALIGLNRGEHDHPAGLRTTMLVCLAASISMIQMNLLLLVSGKTPSSFAVMDLMRLPLGILTGVGFIGAGAILKKGDLVRGVTTAATLWYVTVVGLCLGGGQLALGIIATALGWFILTVLKTAERHWHRERHGVLTLICDASGPDCDEVRRHVEAAGAHVMHWTHLQQRRTDGCCKNACEVAWKARPHDPVPLAFLDEFSKSPGVLQIDWHLSI